jgi:hypothetical protein
VRLLGTDDNRVLSLLALNRNALSTSQEALWCVLMALLSGLASFLAGRHASLWQQDVTR